MKKKMMIMMMMMIVQNVSMISEINTRMNKLKQ